jgi:hypothetical protein
MKTKHILILSFIIPLTILFFSIKREMHRRDERNKALKEMLRPVPLITREQYETLNDREQGAFWNKGGVIHE